MPTGKMSRRHFVQLFGATAAATLVACAPKPTSAPQAEPTAKPADTEVPVAEPTSAPPAAGEAVKVTVFVGLGTGTEPSQIEVHNQIAADFNGSQQAIQVEFLTVPYEERNTKLATMLAGDMAPDIAMPIGVQGIAAYFDEWVDLKPYIDRDKYDMSDFVGATVQIHQYPGRLLGLPMGVYPEVLYYNEDMFDTAGLEYPPHKWDDKTWNLDKVVEIAKKLTLDEAGNDASSGSFDPAGAKQWGWDGLSWIGCCRDVAPKWGGSPMGVSDDYKTAQYTAQPYLDASQWLYDTVWTWHIRANGEQTSLFDEAGDPLGSNMVAMWICQSWMQYAYSGWTDAFNWNIAAVPAGPTGVVATDEDADTFTIFKHSKNPDQAWEVSKYFASAEVLPKLCQSWGPIPARQSNLATWKDTMTADFGEKDWQVILDSVNYMFLPNSESWVPDSEKVLDILAKAWEVLTTTEGSDVKEVMEKANAEVQTVLDEYWKAHS